MADPIISGITGMKPVCRIILLQHVYRIREVLSGFGTKEGLNRFDGFQFKIFLHSPSVSNCLANNFITSLCEDGDGWNLDWDI